MTPDEYRALPFAQIRVTHGFPSPADDSVAVYVDDRPVARLAATEVAFKQNYGQGYGHVTLTLIAGDCHIASRPSRPRQPGHD